MLISSVVSFLELDKINLTSIVLAIWTGSAHQDVWRQARPGQFEFEMEAIFRSTCMRSGYSSLGYPAIIGSGSNSAILHYETNRRRANEGELVLIDAGACTMVN